MELSQNERRRDPRHKEKIRFIKKKIKAHILDEWMVLFSADEWTDESSEIKVELSYTILFIPGDVLVVPIFLYIYVYSPDF